MVAECLYGHESEGVLGVNDVTACVHFIDLTGAVHDGDGGAVVADGGQLDGLLQSSDARIDGLDVAVARRVGVVSGEARLHYCHDVAVGLHFLLFL